MTADALIIEAAKRLFADLCTTQVLVEADSGTWPKALWNGLQDFGIGGVMLDAGQGGIGLGPDEAMALVRVAGRYALPLPVPETMIANWLLSLAGREACEGPATLALSPQLRLEPHGDGFVLNGSAAKVPWARLATILAVVDTPEGTQLVLLPPDKCTIAEGTNIANEPRDRVTFDTRLGSAEVASVPFSVDALRLTLAAARCAQMAGAIDRIGEMTTGYAVERKQFGRPIAGFQAVQQNLAIICEHVALAQAAADLAAESLMAGDAGAMGVASAKAVIGDSAGKVAALAHQVHGAIGFTHEYPLHFLTRRLWSWREEYGNETQWAIHFGRSLAGCSSGSLWDAIARV